MLSVIEIYSFCQKEIMCIASQCKRHQRQSIWMEDSRLLINVESKLIATWHDSCNVVVCISCHCFQSMIMCFAGWSTTLLIIIKRNSIEKTGFYGLCSTYTKYV